jgi:hypothetical protein
MCAQHQQQQLREALQGWNPVRNCCQEHCKAHRHNCWCVRLKQFTRASAAEQPLQCGSLMVLV